jgi:hypothetical protein
VPPRHSDNDKRRLHKTPDRTVLGTLRGRVSYNGHPKHKAEPLRFGLALYTGEFGDETRCDEHANFQPSDMPGVRLLLIRGIDAGLIGHKERGGLPTILWTVSDQGWIFEARVTNAGQGDYHGYPVRTNEAIAGKVLERFDTWAQSNGSGLDRLAAAKCRERYRIAR